MAAWERPDVCMRMKKTRRYDLGQKRKDKTCVQLKKKEPDEPISHVQLHIGETYQHKGYASHFP
jgi:hypothetical protein